MFIPRHMGDIPLKYFLDTEFIEDGSTINLLSIGIVAEDGREFYQCNKDAKLNRADDWLIWNVYPQLGVYYRNELGWQWKDSRDKKSVDVVSYSDIRGLLKNFIGDDPSPEFWGYYADYDWVVVCQLFGRMIDLPLNWPKYCNDLKQLAVSKGDPELSKQGFEHHALNDARWIRDQHLFLSNLATL